MNRINYLNIFMMKLLDDDQHYEFIERILKVMHIERITFYNFADQKGTYEYLI